ncbi:uncharacterized protein UV8b_08157 [Ustilaginoidea virens]|uniref:Uncharacterized protein n=1 Tax=Ustilaginoidea virens TaxID=1159556 RepID=A0A8E5MLG2_USTVR|nr:uncharacterized protein UV8b_08157 [Ustilaginoidea virens]QUC23916.1 hypothetical protein UV8b_08157 [Ustilaginoidea virens]
MGTKSNRASQHGRECPSAGSTREAARRKTRAERSCSLAQASPPTPPPGYSQSVWCFFLEEPRGRSTRSCGAQARAKAPRHPRAWCRVGRNGD